MAIITADQGVLFLTRTGMIIFGRPRDLDGSHLTLFMDARSPEDVYTDALSVPLHFRRVFKRRGGKSETPLTYEER